MNKAVLLTSLILISPLTGLFSQTPSPATLAGQVLDGTANYLPIGGNQAWVVAYAGDPFSGQLRVLGYAHPDKMGRWSIALKPPGDGTVAILAFHENVLASVFYDELLLAAGQRVDLGKMATTLEVPEIGRFRALPNAAKLKKNEVNYNLASQVLRAAKAHQDLGLSASP